MWVAAGLIQAAALVLLAIAVLTLSPIAAGAAAIVLFAVFCVASGAGSVAFQDVVGKTIPKGVRGRMLVNRAFLGGIFAIGAAAMLKFTDLTNDGAVAVILSLVLSAAILWAVGAILFAVTREEAGATEGSRTIIAELKNGLVLARNIDGFRKYLTARALLLSVELSMPVFVLQADELGAATVTDLPVYIFAVALSAVVSSPFWGRFADRDSEKVMALSGVLGAAAGISMIVFPLMVPAMAVTYVLAIFFVLLGIAEAGVRLGRKTYLVDGAPADERPLYTAFSNTVVGVLAIAGISLGFLADVVSPTAAVGVIVIFGIAGAMAAHSLPPAENMVDHRTPKAPPG